MGRWADTPAKILEKITKTVDKFSSFPDEWIYVNRVYHTIYECKDYEKNKITLVYNNNNC